MDVANGQLCLPQGITIYKFLIRFAKKWIISEIEKRFKFLKRLCDFSNWTNIAYNIYEFFFEIFIIFVY